MIPGFRTACLLHEKRVTTCDSRLPSSQGCLEKTQRGGAVQWIENAPRRLAGQHSKSTLLLLLMSIAPDSRASPGILDG